MASGFPMPRPMASVSRGNEDRHAHQVGPDAGGQDHGQHQHEDEGVLEQAAQQRLEGHLEELRDAGGGHAHGRAEGDPTRRTAAG